MPIKGKSVLAIAAIKILNDHFSKDKKLWYLVEKKARKYILSNTGLSKDDLDKVLKTFQPMYQELVGVESEKWMKKIDCEQVLVKLFTTHYINFK